MQGHKEVIDRLNFLLADELTAISQYMVQANMLENWKYLRLAKVTEARAHTEMKHADLLMNRILFLEGLPVVSTLNQFTIGSSIEEILRNDKDKEVTAIQGYNDAMGLAQEYNDAGSFSLFQDNEEDEEEHLDYIEGQLSQIGQIGIVAYSQAQIREE